MLDQYALYLQLAGVQTAYSVPLDTVLASLCRVVIWLNLSLTSCSQDLLHCPCRVYIPSHDAVLKGPTIASALIWLQPVY
jgi:hypothetical protein